jgi:hypothetical protein
MVSSPFCRWFLGFAVALGGLGGCSGSGGDAGDGGAPACFDPIEASFNGFHGWMSADASNDGGVMDGVHGLGPMKVYWNKSPPHGSTTFPVGTIIVKETEQSDPTQRVVFAMAKEGCGYNAPTSSTAGALGWQWVSLQNNADGTVKELWGGPVAPAGQTYAGMPVGDCNGCHAGAAKNDHVWDSALQLSSF